MSPEFPKSIPDDESLFPNKTSTDARATENEEPIVIPEWAKGAYKYSQMPTPPDVILNNVTRPEAMEEATKKGIGFYIVDRNDEQTKVISLSVFVSDRNKKIKEFYCVRKPERPFYKIINRSLPNRIVSIQEILKDSTLRVSKEVFNKLNNTLAGIFVEDKS
jgi:hypothetical protein